jgi:hypothetical protein
MNSLRIGKSDRVVAGLNAGEVAAGIDAGEVAAQRIVDV